MQFSFFPKKLLFKKISLNKIRYVSHKYDICKLHACILIQNKNIGDLAKIMKISIRDIFKLVRYHLNTLSNVLINSTE